MIDNNQLINDNKIVTDITMQLVNGIEREPIRMIIRLEIAKYLCEQTTIQIKEGLKLNNPQLTFPEKELKQLIEHQKKKIGINILLL